MAEGGSTCQREDESTYFGLSVASLLRAIDSVSDSINLGDDVGVLDAMNVVEKRADDMLTFLRNAVSEFRADMLRQMTEEVA